MLQNVSHQLTTTHLPRRWCIRTPCWSSFGYSVGVPNSFGLPVSPIRQSGKREGSGRWGYLNTSHQNGCGCWWDVIRHTKFVRITIVRLQYIHKCCVCVLPTKNMLSKFFFAISNQGDDVTAQCWKRQSLGVDGVGWFCWRRTENGAACNPTEECRK